ncbi:MAG: hypothetical protein V7L21_04800 [Nostoc sp.]|uniref:hypothetical protein n=1 Tax=unclassified Nostoc TaxID=2593658 RepID=UPI0025E512FB|nr:hypothetical protein [Nostoc sp. NMS9]MBN3939572.1 hypothetical protein [Nostoc sp. NMS9]
MSLNFQRTRDLLSKFKFSDLFIEELGWSKPSRQKPVTLKIDNKTYQLQSLAADNYKKILEEKNKSVDLYKKHAFLPKTLPDTDTPQDTRLIHLRKNIEQLNNKSQEKLNLLLLDEFSKRLGIKYEEVR